MSPDVYDAERLGHIWLGRPSSIDDEALSGGSHMKERDGGLEPSWTSVVVAKEVWSIGGNQSVCGWKGRYPERWHGPAFLRAQICSQFAWGYEIYFLRAIVSL